jgi:hypothetical protein
MGMHVYCLEADDRLVFVEANLKRERILGVVHAQFLGKTIEEAFPNLAGTEIVKRHRRAAASRPD